MGRQSEIIPERLRQEDRRIARNTDRLMDRYIKRRIFAHESEILTERKTETHN